MAHPICRSDGARPSAPGRFRSSIRNARRAPAAGEPGPCAHMRSPKEATFSCLSRGDVLPLFQWSPARENAALSGCSDIALPIAPSRSPPDERGVRLAKFEREQLIVDFLNRGHVGRRDHGADRRRRKAHARPHPGPPDWDYGDSAVNSPCETVAKAARCMAIECTVTVIAVIAGIYLLSLNRAGTAWIRLSLHRPNATALQGFHE